MKGFEAAFAKWVLSHRLYIIIACLAGVGVMGSGLDKIYFDSSYRIFFGKENPQLLAFESLENTYTKNDSVVIVVAPHSGQIFTRDSLAAIEVLTDEAWQTPYSNRVDSITNFQYTEAEEDDLIVRDMVKNAESLLDEDLDKIRAAVLAEPALVDRLITSRADVTGIVVNLQLPSTTRHEATPEIVKHMRAMVATFKQQHPQFDVYLTGVSMMDNAFFESAMDDGAFLMPLSFVLMIGLIALLVGGFFGTLVIVMVITLSIVVAMGMSGHLGMPLNSFTTSAPIIILTVAVANCVHLLVSFIHGMHKGETRVEAMEESLRINLQPVFLASATTAIGFLTMNFSEVPPFNDLGNIVSVGVVTSFILTIFMLPAVMSLLPVRIKKMPEDDNTLMIRLAEFVIAKRKQLLWGMTIFVLAAVANLPRNELNDVFVHYFAKSTDFRQATDFMVDNLTGIYVVNFSLDSGESGGISEPEFLREVESFAQWVEVQPEVVHVDRFTNTMKRLNKNMHGDDENYYKLPEERNLAAQYLLLYEMSLPYGLDLNNQINVDKSSTKLAITTHVISSNAMIEFDHRAHAWLRDNVAAVKRAESAGTVLMFSNIGQRNIRAMLIGTTVALVLISGILIIALRSLKLGLVSLLPNLVPAAVGFGIWGIFVGEVGLSLSVVTGMTFGIVIDNTVHFLSKYLRARRESGLNSQDAVRYAFRTVGRALVVTTTTLVVGFSVLATSAFELNSGMGMMTAIIVSVALVAVFLLLPPLLMKIEEEDTDAQIDNSSTSHSATA